MQTPFIVGVRFTKVGKIYHFDASGVPDLKVGDFTVVDTSRGRQLGEVVQFVEAPQPSPEGAWKPILRRATPRDLVLRQLFRRKELEAIETSRARLSELKIPGVKIVEAEYTFDGSRLSILFSTEAEEKLDLKNLRNAVQRAYPRTHVELRQIGPRDAAKIMGGMGACGLENRCCSRFLCDFSPISIKMAKEQGISLTPTEITGICGRLRCCLVYEYEQYAESRKQLPKKNKRVVTALGEGRIVDVLPLKQAVIVELDTGVQREFMHFEVTLGDDLEALKRMAQGPAREADAEEDSADLQLPDQAEAPRPPSPAPRAEHPPRPRGEGRTEAGDEGKGDRRKPHHKHHPHPKNKKEAHDRGKPGGNPPA